MVNINGQGLIQKRNTIHPFLRVMLMGHLQVQQPSTAGERVIRLKNLSIQDFRSFGRFKLKNLGQINLLVGTNNCGKTTLLEAVNILMANGDFTAIWSTLLRRGEDIYGERDPVSSSSGRQVDIRRLFRGHEIEVGTSFSSFPLTQISAAWRWWPRSTKTAPDSSNSLIRKCH